MTREEMLLFAQATGLKPPPTAWLFGEGPPGGRGDGQPLSDESKMLCSWNGPV